MLHDDEAKILKESVSIKVDHISLEGELIIPSDVTGVVLFAHGSGSSRFSPRNQFIASLLRKGSVGTLLVDLLTHEEEEIERETRHLRFDIDLLTERLLAITDWLEKNEKTKKLKIGYFGSSTGAAAALKAAARRKKKIKAVVSRGGRPDLAGMDLREVEAPTLFIVGGNDFGVIELNEEAFQLLRVEKSMEIVPEATHLFEESGALEEVGRLASLWFNKYL